MDGCPPHAGAHLPRSPQISPYLPTPPHISPHLPTSPHISPHLPPFHDLRSPATRADGCFACMQTTGNTDKIMTTLRGEVEQLRRQLRLDGPSDDVAAATTVTQEQVMVMAANPPSIPPRADVACFVSSGDGHGGPRRRAAAPRIQRRCYAPQARARAGMPSPQSSHPSTAFHDLLSQYASRASSSSYATRTGSSGLRATASWPRMRRTSLSASSSNR